MIIHEIINHRCEFPAQLRSDQTGAAISFIDLPKNVVGLNASTRRPVDSIPSSLGTAAVHPGADARFPPRKNPCVCSSKRRRFFNTCQLKPQTLLLPAHVEDDQPIINPASLPRPLFRSAELLRDHCPKASQTSRQATDALHAVQPEGKQEGKTPIHGVCFYCLSSYPLKGCRGSRVGNSRAMTPSPTSQTNNCSYYVCRPEKGK